MLKTIYVYTGILFLLLGMVFEGAHATQDSLQQPALRSAPKLWDPQKTGLLSAAIPGAGQFYTGHYIKSGAFLSAGVTTALVARFWYTTWEERLAKADEFRSEMVFARTKSDSLLVDESVAIVRFDAKSARYTMYDALSWMVGAYVFNIADALKCSGALNDTEERSALKAAWLAAIPGLGLGQVYNGEFSKAGLVVMTQVSLGVIAMNEHRLMRRAQERYLALLGVKDSAWLPVVDKYREDWQSRQNNAFSNRNSYLWYSLFFYFYGMLDAVVDAHLHDYERKMRVYPDLVPQRGGAVGMKMEYMF